jgi:hypothetical protein
MAAFIVIPEYQTRGLARKVFHLRWDPLTGWMRQIEDFQTARALESRPRRGEG